MKVCGKRLKHAQGPRFFSKDLSSRIPNLASREGVSQVLHDAPILSKIIEYYLAGYGDIDEVLRAVIVLASIWISIICTILTLVGWETVPGPRPQRPIELPRRRDFQQLQAKTRQSSLLGEWRLRGLR